MGELVSPMDSATINTENYNVTFGWREAVDIERDTLTYNLYLEIAAEHVDTLFTTRGIEKLFKSYQAVDSLLYHLGFRSEEVERDIPIVWWVEGDDGSDVTPSVKRTLFVPIKAEVSVARETAPVTEYALNSAYPNPFNATLTIGYQLPQEGMVSVAIFDLSGRLVSRLVEQNRQAGRHTVTWRANEIPSGLYIVRMSAGEFIAYRKVQLIK